MAAEKFKDKIIKVFGMEVDNEDGYDEIYEEDVTTMMSKILKVPSVRQRRKSQRHQDEMNCPLTTGQKF